MKLSFHELYEFLEEKHDQYNRKTFIETDPIQVPHSFTKKEDIEISGFLTATIAWGKRATIINNAKLLMSLMENAPYEFILSATEKDLTAISKFVHRTFNGTTCIYFIKSIQNIYRKYGGIHSFFERATNKKDSGIREAIIALRKVFFELPFPKRTAKHFSDPETKSASKRINMYLRWMIRSDKRKVDFGLWKNIKADNLLCPLDVHSGNVARKLGLLKRKQNDFEAVIELTETLKKFDAKDPVKYDFALFGLGVNEKF